jgi:MFS family permease
MANTQNKRILGLPKGVWILGFVGLLINLATIMVFSVMPLFMETELGASRTEVGRIDGFVEFVAYLIRIFSGAVGDIFQNRKAVLGVGYTLSMLVKPMFAMASSVIWIFWIRSLDRVSNGIQASPRDALIGDLAPKNVRGASYGMTKSLKTAGSFIGSALVVVILTYSDISLRTLFLYATIPAGLALILFVLGVKEPRHKDKFTVEDKVSHEKKFRWSAFKELNWSYWKVIILTAIFQLAHFGESYLVFRVRDAGLPNENISLVMLFFNIGQFLVAYPLGRLSDRVERRKVLLSGFILMICAGLVMALTHNIYIVMSGVFLWGAQFGITQSIFVSIISDVTPQYIRGTAFGIFYIIMGVAIFISSWFAGTIWDVYGYKTLFLTSACISFFSCFMLFVLLPSYIKKNS